MDLCRVFVIAFLLSSIVPFALAEAPESCAHVATSVPPPVTAEVPGAWKIEVESFLVPVPGRPERTLLGGGDLTLIYPDGAVLVVGTGPVPTGQPVPRPAAEIPKRVFTEKLCGEPHGDDGVSLLATILKPKYVEEADRLIRSRSGPLTYYLSDTQWQGFSGRAFVTHDAYANLYLQIDAKGMDFERFQRIVFNIRAR